MSNVFIKLQSVRCDLQKTEMKKTGFNKFNQFAYWENADFLPTVNELCLKHGITPIIVFTKEEATMTIYNHDDKEDNVVFKIPFVVPQLKGSNTAQMLGSAQTYFTKYLYINAFTLAESDGLDCLSEEDRTEISKSNTNKTDNEKEDKIAIIKMRAKNNKELIIEAMKNAKVSKLEDLSVGVLDELVKALK